MKSNLTPKDDTGTWWIVSEIKDEKLKYLYTQYDNLYSECLKLTTVNKVYAIIRHSRSLSEQVLRLQEYLRYLKDK